MNSLDGRVRQVDSGGGHTGVTWDWDGDGNRVLYGLRLFESKVRLNPFSVFYHFIGHTYNTAQNAEN